MTANHQRFECLHEIVNAARDSLNEDIWDYLRGGTDSETTVMRNRLALDSLAFRPRVLVDVAEVSCRTHFLGHDLRLPVTMAPVGSLESFAAGGGVTAHAGAAEVGAGFCISSVSSGSLEDVAAAVNNHVGEGGPTGAAGSFIPAAPDGKVGSNCGRLAFCAQAPVLTPAPNGAGA